MTDLPGDAQAMGELSDEILDLIHDHASAHGPDPQLRAIIGAAIGMAIVALENDGLPNLGTLVAHGAERARKATAPTAANFVERGFPADQAVCMAAAEAAAQETADLLGERLRPFDGNPFEVHMALFVIDRLVQAAEHIRPGFILAHTMGMIADLRHMGKDAALMLDGKPYTGDPSFDRPQPGMRRQ